MFSCQGEAYTPATDFGHKSVFRTPAPDATLRGVLAKLLREDVWQGTDGRDPSDRQV